MVGLFWKKLRNPIETGLINEGQATFITPMNFGDRHQRRSGGGHNEILQLVRNQSKLHLHALEHNDQQAGT